MDKFLIKGANTWENPPSQTILPQYIWARCSQAVAELHCTEMQSWKTIQSLTQWVDIFFWWSIPIISHSSQVKIEQRSPENEYCISMSQLEVCHVLLLLTLWYIWVITLGDFKNISTISIFLLAVAPYNFCNFDTKMV